jgi:hypothetical protein
MSLPSGGMTQDVIREMMPPYHLSDGLLQVMFAALPPPPPDATAAWRHARITRLRSWALRGLRLPLPLPPPLVRFAAQARKGRGRRSAFLPGRYAIPGRADRRPRRTRSTVNA